MRIEDISYAPEGRIHKVNYLGYRDYPFITIGKRSYIAGGICEVILPAHILIGNYTSIAADVEFLINIDHDYLAVSNYHFFRVDKVFPSPLEDCEFNKQVKRQIIIGNDVWIGRGVQILGGVKIGNGAVIAAGALVTKDVAPYTIVGGNPARFIKYRFSEELCHCLNQIKWWYWDEKKIIANHELMTKPQEFVEKFLNPVVVAESSLKNELQQLRTQGKKIFFFPLDTADKYPVWQNVIIDYLDNMNTDTDFMLLGVLPGQPADAVVAFLQSQLASRQKMPTCQLVQLDREFRLDILQAIDYFVTNKQSFCLSYIDFAHHSHVRILSGIDKHPFKYL